MNDLLYLIWWGSHQHGYGFCVAALLVALVADRVIPE